MRRSKQLCLLAAVDAVALGGLGAFATTAHADTVKLNITQSGGNYQVYLDDKAGDPGVVNTGNLGLATFSISVVGSGGETVTKSTQLTKSFTYSFNTTGSTNSHGSGGFDLSSSNGSAPGVVIAAAQGTAKPQAVGTAGEFSIVGYGISSGNNLTIPNTDPALQASTVYTPSKTVSWTQTSLGVEIASGTYSGSGGVLEVFGDDGSLGASGMPHENDTSSIQVLPAGWTQPAAINFVTATPGFTGTVAPTQQPIVCLSNTLPTKYGAQLGTPITSNGGSNGSYPGVTQTFSSATQGFVQVNGYFNPSNDHEDYFYDVQVNGVQATQAQIASLIALINGTTALGGVDTSGAGTSQKAAGTTFAYNVAAGGLPIIDPFGSQYNLLLDFPTSLLGTLGVTDTLNNGLDLSQEAGYSVVGVAVVPEPATLGLLALGSLGIFGMGRRRRI